MNYWEIMRKWKKEETKNSQKNSFKITKKNIAHLFAIQFIQRVIHIIPTPKLDNALAGPLIMRVRVGDLTALPEKILQILPRRFCGQIFDDDTIAGLTAGRVATPTRRRTAPTAQLRVLAPHSGSRIITNGQKPDIWDIWGLKLIVQQHLIWFNIP